MAQDFDTMTELFTTRVRHAAEWKHGYFGAAYSSRIRQAVAELKRAIEIAEAHPEIGHVDPETYFPKAVR